MDFEVTPDVHLSKDPKGTVRQLRHPHKPYTVDQAGLAAVGAPVTPRALAEQYLRDVAPLYQLAPTATTNFAAALAPSPTNDAAQLRFHEEKSAQNSTTISYAQTLYGLPVWDAGVTVRLNNKPLQVTSSHSAAHIDLGPVAKLPPDAPFLPNRIEPAKLKQVLGLAGPDPVVTSTRQLIYRYEPDQRLDPRMHGHPEEGGPPLKLPDMAPAEPPATVQAGKHYIVTEVLFNLDTPGWQGLHWRAFLDPVSGAVLYLRALVACATGHVFLSDPVTLSGQAHTAATAANVLDALRAAAPLLSLTPPASPTAEQELKGQLVTLRDTDPPHIAMPTRPEPFDFDYSCPSDNFAAVCAYHHCDGVYRLIQSLGFNLSDFFSGTTFPVPVDPHAGGWAGFGGSPVNAAALGNANSTGMGRFIFGIAQAGQTMGIAADVRVVLHEFGHAVLYDHVGGPNFGFAHSPGDSLGAILHDPHSKAADRFETFPFMKSSGSISRRHDRKVEDGWAWFGSRYNTQYLGEQVLSTTLFRIYRAAGGDSQNVAVKEAASRHVLFLILAGVHGLSFTTTDPDVYVTAMIDADNANSFGGEPGGTMDKVIRWSFEKQGLYQPPDAEPPFSTPGAPPDVDVYIDDGRKGECMPYREAFDQTPASEVWNRTANDGGTADQAPAVGVTNFLFAVIRNRGTQAAQNVRVRAFQSKTATPAKWPTDWKPMTTASLPLAGDLASGASVKVGPFQWTPEFAGQSVLVSVSAPGDRSHAETVVGAVSNARLVPLDNNIAQRKF
jgi:hypothetical protein